MKNKKYNLNSLGFLFLISGCLLITFDYNILAIIAMSISLISFYMEIVHKKKKKTFADDSKEIPVD
jgi:hypothetical protein